MKFKLWMIALPIQALAALALGSTSPVLAGPQSLIVVTTTNDELNGDGDCSLREAIKAANSNAAVSGCAAGSASATDTVRLASGETYTLTLDSDNDDADTDDTNTTGDLDILQKVNFTTNSTARAIIKGKLLWKERLVEVAPNTTVTFTRIEFRNGNTQNGLGGGGIATGTGSNVTLSGCVVAENDAAGNGGGILNKGIMTITNSTVSDNQSAEHDGGGGGIFNDADANLTLTNSTISNNEAEGEGISADDGGGGIFNNDATLIITNSTIQGNNVKGDRDRGGRDIQHGQFDDGAELHSQ